MTFIYNVGVRIIIVKGERFLSLDDSLLLLYDMFSSKKHKNTNDLWRLSTVFFFLTKRIEVAVDLSL